MLVSFSKIMDFIHKDIEREYLRWLKHFDNDTHFTFWTISPKDVLRAHFLIIDHFKENEEYWIGGVGPRDTNLFDSAVCRQFTSFGGKEKWSDDYEKCATLFYWIIKNHPFHDANKRTGFLISLFYLEKIGRVPDVSLKDYEKLAVQVAENNLNQYPEYRELKKKTDDPEVRLIARFFRKNTRKIDKKSYVITYNQLNTCLRAFRCGLANPSKGHIDVIRYEETKTFFTSEIVTKETKLKQIVFPGWGREVSKKTISEIRQIAGLNSNVDSWAFFKGLDPVKTLIWGYAWPLRRLAGK